MTPTTVARGTDRMREAFARLEERRAGEPPWLRELRREALARFEALGFPGPKHEDWRRTNVARLAAVAWAPDGEGSGASREVERSLEAAPSGTRLVFVNGVFSRELSTLRASGAVVTTLREALSSGFSEAAREHLERTARDGTSFSALNTAFFEDAAFVYVPERVSVPAPIELAYVATAPREELAQNLRALVVLEAGARATLLERALAPRDDVYRTNAVTEVVLGPGASLDHVRLQQESDRALRVSLLAVEQAAASRYVSCTVSLGGALTREDARLVLAGEGAEGLLDGLAGLAGEQQDDHRVLVEHRSPGCRSRHEHRSIASERARSTFRGRIVVRPGASRTAAEQTSRSLLLSDDASADASPELEIHADDVKCSHGATVGRLSADALFYLRSRGIDPRTARAMLTHAFASVVVDRVRSEPVRALVEEAVRARLCPAERHLAALEREREVAS